VTATKLAHISAGFLALLLAAGCNAPATDWPEPVPALSAALPTVAATTAAQAEGTVDQRAGVAYAIPPGWGCEATQGYSLLAAPNRSLRIAIFVGGDARDNASVASTEAAVEKVVTQLARVGLPEHASVNGRSVVVIRGTGIAGDRLVSWSAQRLHFGKPVVVVAFAAHDEFEAYQPEIDRFVASLRAI
jgi:hypothetical protein